MRLLFTAPFALGAAGLLCGCQVWNTSGKGFSLSDPPANAATAYGPAPPPIPQSRCNAPPSVGPTKHLPQPVDFTQLYAPPLAAQAHVSGCGGVKFRIGPDGAATDITVVVEYPLGYGFADAARAQVANMRWETKNTAAWRYLVVNLNPPPP